ncbi:MAG: hypothetical protein WDN06_04115 [Asticcacaulis sp.]
MLTEEPATDLSFKTMADMERLKDALDGQVLGGRTLRSALRGNIAEWAGYDEGVWWVQDASAAVAVGLLGDLTGQARRPSTCVRRRGARPCRCSALAHRW